MSGREEGEIIDPPAEGPVLRFIRLTPRAYAPERMTEGSAGYDIKSPRTGAILPQRKLTLQTELSLEIPKGYVGKIYPRSGLADQYCITTLGGIIDSDFRGNVSIILMNLHKVNVYLYNTEGHEDSSAAYRASSTANPERNNRTNSYS